MAKFLIEGGAPLAGDIYPSGNKNEALPAIMACLLTEDPVTLKRVPRIGDVLTTCQILEHLGATVVWNDGETVTITARHISSPKPPPGLCAVIRASILLLGPMLARVGAIDLPLPGGDVIGARRIDTHWEGLTALGAQLSFDKSIKGTLRKRAIGCDIYLDEPSVTATENILMLATLAKGRTTIHHGACEPHVVGLCNLLNRMGAKITGHGTNRIIIEGVDGLHSAEHEIGVDFMEVGSYLCLGSIAGGRLNIHGAKEEDFRFILKSFAKIGIEPEWKSSSILSIDGTKPLATKKEISGRISSIYSGPWPAFPTDLMSVAIVAATQAAGAMIFFEKMFEARMFFTDKLMQMGAQIVLCDPHRIVVTGPSRLFGAKLSSPDVRAGMALVTAALVAQGDSVIDNIYQIERGYAFVVEKLQGIGAQIKRV